MLDEKQVGFVTLWQAVTVTYQGKEYPAEINAIGVVADQTFGYPVTIKVSGITTTLWWTVEVTVPIETNNITIPLKAVEIIGNSKGYIYLRKDNIVEKTEVEIGAVRWDKVEIVSTIDISKEIIINDMTNYKLGMVVETKE
jgi:hypothetical protein